MSNGSRSIGRSVSILGASTRLRERLGRVLYLFRQNAYNLYPDMIRDYTTSHPTPVRPVRHWKTRTFLSPTINKILPSTDLDKFNGLGWEFRQFSEDVVTLFDCFCQYPEFLEELPDRSLAQDLEVGIHSATIVIAVFTSKPLGLGPTVGR